MLTLPDSLAAAVPTLIALAEWNLSQGKPAQALGLAQEAVNLAPRDVRANFLVGKLTLDAGKAADALPHLEVCIQEAPMTEDHWTHYVRALITVGAIETAAQAIEFGIQFGLSVAAATQLAQDYVQARSQSAVTADIQPEFDYWSLPPAPAWPHIPLSKTADLSYITPPESKGRRYVIVSPPYRHNSAGIRVMHDLQKWLIRAGYDAIVITTLSGFNPEQFSEDIVVYPEVVQGNPLKSKRVVRYILNYPGKIGGDTDYAPHELRVAYNEILAPFAQGKVLQIPSTEPFFCLGNKDRKQTAYYVGKGKNLYLHPQDAIQITSNHPAQRRNLAHFLQTVSTLYCYDDFTMLAHEAQLCGCHVEFLLDPTNKKEIIRLATMPDLKMIKHQLHDFIQQSQSI